MLAPQETERCKKLSAQESRGERVAQNLCCRHPNCWCDRQARRDPPGESLCELQPDDEEPRGYEERTAQTGHKIQRRFWARREEFCRDPSEKNEERITGGMRLVMPDVEGPHAHRKLHSIDFIERRRMCEKVKREGGQKKEHGFNQGLLARIALIHLG